MEVVVVVGYFVFMVMALHDGGIYMMLLEEQFTHKIWLFFLRVWGGGGRERRGYVYIFFFFFFSLFVYKPIVNAIFFSLI